MITDLYADSFHEWAMSNAFAAGAIIVHAQEQVCSHCELLFLYLLYCTQKEEFRNYATVLDATVDGTSLFYICNSICQAAAAIAALEKYDIKLINTITVVPNRILAKYSKGTFTVCVIVFENVLTTNC